MLLILFIVTFRGHLLKLLTIQYFLTIVDDATRSTWLYLMKSKYETRPLLISFYNMICTQFNIHIKAIRADNAPEFFLKDFYASHNIIH